MKLIRLTIENLRAIELMEIDMGDFTSFIGPNNTGKSSVLRALEILLNQDKPEPTEWRKDCKAEPIRIIGIFEDIQDWERDTPGVSGLINDGRITLRATAICEGENASLSYDAYIRPTIIEGWAEKWSALSPDIKSIAQGIGIDGQGWRTSANKERVREAVIQQRPETVEYGEPVWTSENISIDAALKQAVPQVVFVHAVKDASDDAKPTARTSFGLLLKRIVLPAIQKSDEYQALIIAVQALSDKMRATGEDQLETVTRLADVLSQRMSAIIETRVVFKLDTPDTDKFVGANTGINLDDGTETPIHLQGHGAQRALIFAMIEVLANQDATIQDEFRRSTILLFEEPEIYLHPHLMRRLKDSLTDISARPDWQVLITTHSPFFVNVAEDPMSLVILNRADPTRRIIKKQLSIDPFAEDGGARDDRTALRAALDFHPTVAEAFFAQRIVLVEGDTELSVFRHTYGLHRLFEIDQLNYDTTTIVSCGGKWTIPAVARILRAFEIPFRIIHDLDKKGRDEEQLQQAAPIDPYRANARIRDAAGSAEIHVVDDTFEHVLWPEEMKGKSSDKPFRAWQRVKTILDGDISIDEVPKLKELFEFAYLWN
jgi:energy-coupling factor transporter ATP-binding protein EcfA2